MNDAVEVQCLGHLVDDEKQGNLALEAVDGAGERFSGLGVQHTGRFVEDQDLGALEQGAGDGQTLTLPAGQTDAALADLGLVALRQSVDEIVDSASRQAVTMSSRRGWGAAAKKLS